MNDIPMHLSEPFRRLCREGLWVTLGQAGAVVGALVGVRLLTELMEPAAYGELALGMTVATLVNQVVMGPLGNGATRFYAPACVAGDISGYLAAVRRMVLSATGWIIPGGMLMIVGLVFARHAEWIGLAASALAFALLSGYNSILNGIQNAARQRSIVALHQGMESLMRFFVAAGLMILMGATSTVAMVGFTMTIAMVLGSQYFFFRKIIPMYPASADNERGWRKQMWKYSWPMTITGVMSWGFFASQRWALQLFASSEDVGYFSAISQIGFAPFSMAGGLLMTLTMPIIFNRAGDGVDKQKVKSVSKIIIKVCLATFSIVLLSTAIGAIFHGMIFRLLVAEQYRVVSHYLPYVIFAAGLLQISLFLSMIILVDTKTSRLLPLHTIGSLIVIALTFLLTHFKGMDGLVFAMVSGSSIHLGWNIYNAYAVVKHG